MEMYASGLFALVGTLVGGLITFAVQFHAQRKQDVRHRQKLAYDIAMQQWIVWAQARFEQEKTTRVKQVIPSMSHFIVSQLRLTNLFIGQGVDELTDEELFNALSSIEERNEALFSFFFASFAQKQARRSEEAGA
jgi:hypothetical protein